MVGPVITSMNVKSVLGNPSLDTRAIVTLNVMIYLGATVVHVKQDLVEMVLIVMVGSVQ